MNENNGELIKCIHCNKNFTFENYFDKHDLICKPKSTQLILNTVNNSSNNKYYNFKDKIKANLNENIMNNYKYLEEKFEIDCEICLEKQEINDESFIFLECSCILHKPCFRNYIISEVTTNLAIFLNYYINIIL